MGLAGRSASPRALARLGLSFWRTACPSLGVPGNQDFYSEQIRSLKEGLCSNTLAWNNKIRLRCYFVGLRTEVMINRDSWGYSYLIVRGEILGFMKD